MPRGDNGGDVRYPSRGCRGGGELTGRSLGRGLIGKPGLKGGRELVAVCSSTDPAEDGGPLNIPAKEACGERWVCREEGELSGANARIEGDRDFAGAAGDSSLSNPLGSESMADFDLDTDFDFFCFFDWLRLSCSCLKINSLSRSSSSRVFFLPRSKAGISSTSFISS